MLRDPQSPPKTPQTPQKNPIYPLETQELGKGVPGWVLMGGGGGGVTVVCRPPPSSMTLWGPHGGFWGALSAFWVRFGVPKRPWVPFGDNCAPPVTLWGPHRGFWGTFGAFWGPQVALGATCPPADTLGSP